MSVKDSVNVQSIDNSSEDKMCYKTVETETVRSSLKDLDCNNAYGCDNFSPLCLKLCREELVEYLCLVINKSLSEAVFPSEWTKAKVVPIHRSKTAEAGSHGGKAVVPIYRTNTAEAGSGWRWAKPMKYIHAPRQGLLHRTSPIT